MTGIKLTLIAAVSAAAMTAIAPSAVASEYPWCLAYTGEAGGSKNCGFSTLEQCRASASGNIGFCEANLFYEGPAERTTKRARRGKDHNG
jgi:hypothetical protein